MLSAFHLEKLKTNGFTFMLFGFVSACMFFLCLKGGFFGFTGKEALDISFNGINVFIPSGQFILLFGATWAMCLLMLLMYPRGLSKAKGSIFLLILAIACRLALFAHESSDDMNRYLWEGRMINEGVNPYKYAPDDMVLSDYAKDDPFFPHINHPSDPAIYPPLMLYIFSAITRISYDPVAIKFWVVLFDMGTLLFLILLLARRGLDVRWSVLYAFNPVILYSFAGQGHLDAFQNFFLAGSLYFYGRKLWPMMYFFLALAIQTKYIAVIALPFFINRTNIKYIWVCIFSVILPYVPFFDGKWENLFSGVLHFGSAYAFNGSVHNLFRWISGDMFFATNLCMVVLAGALIFGYIYFHPEKNVRFKDDPAFGCFFAIGALLLLSPTVHFWYVSWIIPFIALFPCVSWLMLCLTISGYFVANGIWFHTGSWYLPTWVMVIEWFFFYLIFSRDIYLFFKRFTFKADYLSPRSLSVVIPVKNEAKNIASCIKALFMDNTVCEVIVVDGNSSDNTIREAQHAGAKVIRHTAGFSNGGGRGGQIYAGIAASKGDVVAIIHSDMLTGPTTFKHMLNVLEKNPCVIGGAVGSKFDSPKWQFRILELANDFRAVFCGISFGDQVQFFRRRPVVRNNIFPNIPLMEDVEFSLQMSRLGRQVFFFGNVMVSSRRWDTKGYRHSFWVVKYVAIYLFKRMFTSPDTATMYRKYYQ